MSVLSSRPVRMMVNKMAKTEGIKPRSEPNTIGMEMTARRKDVWENSSQPEDLSYVQRARDGFTFDVD